MALAPMEFEDTSYESLSALQNVTIVSGGCKKIENIVFVEVTFTVSTNISTSTAILGAPYSPKIQNAPFNLYNDYDPISSQCRIFAYNIYPGASLTTGKTYRIKGFYFI